MKLSAFIEKEQIAQEGEFSALGHADSAVAQSLAYCDTVHYAEMAAANENISCVITTSECAGQFRRGQGVMVCDEPRIAFYRVHMRLLDYQKESNSLIPAIGRGCTIHPSAVVSKDAQIGDHVTVEENAVIKEGVIVGDHCFIDAGAVLGAEGLLHCMDNGNRLFIAQAGGVRLGCHVTVMANAVVARSVHGKTFTTIGDHSVVGISSTVGHEAQIGKNCVISGNCVVARRACLEDEAWIGSSVVLREYVRVGRAAKVMAGSVVVKDVETGKSVSGNFARDHQRNMSDFLRSIKP